SNGYHLLEIKKPGYKTFSKSLDFKRQDYLGVSLEH
ncbi:PEGA domain-containing protein, partial [bacterium]|nr:PEGA domain-containing protein [bacterium]